MSTREAELYKDKIEVSLDGRQIFYLFFGGAVIVGLVFVLGVMVGRRVEARGHVDRAQTAAASDPLAALDRLDSNNGGLTFKNTLMGKPAPTEVERKIDAAKAKKPGDEVAPAVAPPKQDVKPDAKPDAKQEKAADKKKDDKKKPKKAEQKADKDPPAGEPHAAADGPVVTPLSVPAEPKPAGETKTRFTLQLSSFQDKREAETFQSTLRAGGFEPYITEADVNGKTFYRVRLGTYRSLEAANDAKAELEKATKKSASVMRL
jgi:cell division protein FtsN